MALQRTHQQSHPMPENMGNSKAMLCKYNCLQGVQVGQRTHSSILHQPSRDTKACVQSVVRNRRGTEAQLGQEHPESFCDTHQSLALMEKGS